MILWIWLATASTVAVLLTILDKCRAKRKGARRIPEATLLLFGALGGSAAMWLTMLLIRHKTRHLKFMLGLPAILLVQVAVIWLLHARWGAFFG